MANGSRIRMIAPRHARAGQPRTGRATAGGARARAVGVGRESSALGRAPRDARRRQGGSAPSWVRSSFEVTRSATSAHGNGGAVPSNGGNGHARWQPKGGPLIAIAMATHEPAAGALPSDRSSRSASRPHENWVCVISDDARRSGAPGRDAGDPRRRPALPADPVRERRGVYRNFERALELAPSGGRVPGSVRSRRRLVPGKARRRSARRSAPTTSSPTATCGS